MGMEAAPSLRYNAKDIEEDGSAGPLAAVLQDLIRASREKDATIAKLREELEGLRAMAASRTSRGCRGVEPTYQTSSPGSPGGVEQAG